MAETRSVRSGGFSMVEMLVALVFTMVLMAGMAAVFKASLSTFFTSGEALASSRRNKLSIDLLGQDLDTACMYLDDMNVPPVFSAACPGFYVLPNVAITGVPGTPLAGDPLTADQLYFYVDQALPFEGTLVPGGGQNSNGQLAFNGTAAALADQQFNIECNLAAYANLVQAGQHFIFKDQFQPQKIQTVTNPTPTSVQVTLGASPTAGVTGSGPTGTMNSSHLPGAHVVFYSPAQMVRYMVQYLKLDPNGGDGNLIPCLVRDQGVYSTTGFTAVGSPQIITENVAAFKVYLSVSPGLANANSALAWAGDPTGVRSGGWTGMPGWNSGILGTITPDQASITTQLAAVNPSAVAPANDPNWFRSNPVLVRVDVTTRTASQRTEYGNAPNTAAYKLMAQSLIFVPRHSGLPMSTN